MRFYHFLLFFLICSACNTTDLKDENRTEDAEFELESVILNRYDTLTLAKGIKAEILDSLSWPSSIVSYKGGIIIGQNPHRLSGDLNENIVKNKPMLRYFNVAANEQLKEALLGYQTAMCAAPWGGILIATSGINRFDKGYIYHFKDGLLTRIDAMGSSCFTSITAHQTQNGKAIIYYSDFTSVNSNLYKFVADSGFDCSTGVVYVAQLPDNGWLPMDRNKTNLLAKKYKTNAELLANLNEATRVAGYLSNSPVTALTFDKNDGTIKYATMPKQQQGYEYGSVNFIFEDGGQYDGTSFHYNVLLLAGPKDHSHPAQITIDHKNSIWICTGQSIDDMESTTYKDNGGNALLLIPKKGVQSNLVLRIAVAPKKGRFSGLILDQKQNCIYTTLQDQQGKAVLLKLTGPSVEKLLE